MICIFSSYYPHPRTCLESRNQDLCKIRLDAVSNCWPVFCLQCRESSTQSYAFEVTTEAIAGEGMIVTAGGLDMHVPWAWWVLKVPNEPLLIQLIQPIQLAGVIGSRHMHVRYIYTYIYVHTYIHTYIHTYTCYSSECSSALCRCLIPSKKQVKLERVKTTKRKDRRKFCGVAMLELFAGSPATNLLLSFAVICCTVFSPHLGFRKDADERRGIVVGLGDGDGGRCRGALDLPTADWWCHSLWTHHHVWWRRSRGSALGGSRKESGLEKEMKRMYFLKR